MEKINNIELEKARLVMTSKDGVENECAIQLASKENKQLGIEKSLIHIEFSQDTNLFVFDVIEKIPSLSEKLQLLSNSDDQHVLQKIREKLIAGEQMVLVENINNTVVRTFGEPTIVDNSDTIWHRYDKIKLMTTLELADENKSLREANNQLENNIGALKAEKNVASEISERGILEKIFQKLEGQDEKIATLLKMVAAAPEVSEEVATVAEPEETPTPAPVRKLLQ